MRDFFTGPCNLDIAYPAPLFSLLLICNLLPVFGSIQLYLPNQSLRSIYSGALFASLSPISFIVKTLGWDEDGSPVRRKDVRQNSREGKKSSVK